MDNLAESVTDPDLYVIRKHRLWEGYEIAPIAKASIVDILDKANLVVRITEK